MKLFDYIETEKYRIYTILGMKITIKKKQNLIPNKQLNSNINIYNNSFSNYEKLLLIDAKKDILNYEMLDILFTEDYKLMLYNLHLLWRRTIINDSFLELLRIISLKNGIWDNIDKTFWLLYISALYESNNLELAEHLLYKYIDKYKFADIHRYLLVSKFACELNIFNQNIYKSMQIAENLEISSKEKRFENMIKNKTVAIVGNGPQEIGKSKGEEIDSHDIVIRFNNFNIEGFEKDYGSKTDIWIASFGRGSNDYDYYHSNAFVCLAIDFFRIGIPYHMFGKLYDEVIIKNKKIAYFDFDTKIKLLNQMGNINPTSGAITIFKVFNEKKLNNENFSSNDIYGFSFKENDFSASNYHYYNDNKFNGKKAEYDLLIHHKINKEIIFLRKLFNIS